MPIVILGAGGHAKVLIPELHRRDRSVLGIIDNSLCTGETHLGLTVLGGDDFLSDIPPDQIELVNGLGRLPGQDKRRKLAKAMRSKGYRFANVISKATAVSSGLKTQNGIQIMMGAVIQPGVCLGEDVVINTGAIIDHDCVIGDECWISPGVTLCGNVTIGRGAYIGAGSTIVQGITIGAEVVVGAGSVITKPVPPGSRVIQRM